jgi:hypothetical protein
MEDKAATWKLYELARDHPARGVMDPREACSSGYKSSPTPPHLYTILLGL